MATIRRVTSSGVISDFRGAAPDAGGGFRLLAQAFDGIYDRVLPKAIAEETEKGAALGREMAKQQIGGTDQVYVSSAGAPVVDPGGDWLRYSNQGATRNRPVSEKLAGAMSFLPELGVSMEVFSGGQPGIEEGGPRVGSTRHDHGEAADVFFYKDGRRLDWANPADVPVFQEIVKRGKAAGLTGFGAGPGYMQQGSMHIGFGTPAVWGAGGKGENAPAWLVEAFGGSPTVSASSSGGGSPAATPFVPTMMRDADGKLVSKLYDPSSDPIKQAFNLAAGADYQAQVFLKSTTDLMGLREQFALNPEGFQQAATAYVDQMIEAAPDMFKGDIRAGLQREAQQVFLGILDDQHRETRQRAANSNQAIIEKWSDGYAAAVASGDPEQIAAAEAQLNSALAVRERLPGLAWTPEQSGEVIRKAQEDGQRRIETAQNEQVAGWKKMLETGIKAARAGFASAYDNIVDNPLVAATFPDETRELLAFQTLRDQMPSFMRMPPKEQAAALAEMKPTITEPWEIDLWTAGEKAAAENAKAWAEDPIKRAAEVLPEKPMPMPDLENLDALPDWLASRAAYGEKLAAQGFTDRPIFVSKEEATALGSLFGKNMPADLKMGALTAVVGSMGPNAGAFFDQINMTDKTVRAAGQTLAAGVDPKVAEDALIGRQRLDEGMIQMPQDKAVLGGFSKDMRTAFNAAPGASGMFEEVKELAISIYAAGIAPNATEREQKAAMKVAWARALGKSQTPTGARGGVQTIGENPVWLSPSLSGEELTSAMDAAFGYIQPRSGMEGFGAMWGGLEPDTSMWIDLAGAVPTIGGQPITPDMWRRGQVTMAPAGGNTYRLQVRYPDGSVSDARDGTGQPFVFDAAALVDLWRVRAK